MSSSNVLMEANAQWSSRPADQRFGSLEEFQAATDHFRDHSFEADGVDVRDLRLQADGDELELVGRSNVPAKMTHWSFGQVAGLVRAPAGYLRSLGPTMAAQCLNHGLKHREHDDGENLKLLFQKNGSTLLTAVTSRLYERVWNADIARSLLKLRDMSGGVWQPAPAAFDGSRGLYASDRDCFAFMVDNDRKIFEKQEGGLSRGFFVWNSETGSASYGIKTFFYEYVCGNHRVWGASGIQEIRMRHVGDGMDVRALGQLSHRLREYAESSAIEDEQRIKAATTYSLGKDKQEVIDTVAAMKNRPSILSLGLLQRAFDRAVQREDRYGDPTSAWGFTGGLTELAQEESYTNERVDVERAAGKILQMAF